MLDHPIKLSSLLTFLGVKVMIGGRLGRAGAGLCSAAFSCEGIFVPPHSVL